VAFGVVLAARIVGVGRLVGEALAILVVLSYALAVGWEPSVVRGGGGTLASLGWIVARPRDRWHALAVGALVLLAWMPWSALEPASSSRSAVATIFLVLPRMSGVPDAYGASGLLGRPRGRGRVRARDGADRGSTSGGSHLDRPGERRGRAGDAAVSSLTPRRGRDRARASRSGEPRSRGSPAGVLGGSRSSRGSSPSWPSAQVSSPAVIVIVAALVGAFVAVRRLPRYRRRDAVACLVSLALTASTVACALANAVVDASYGLRVTFLDVGQGDPRSSRRRVGGARRRRPARSRRRRPASALGLRSLTAIVLTHPQRDRIGGAARVLDRLEVGAVGDPGIEAPHPTARRCSREARRRGVPVVSIHAGEVFRIGDLRLRILWPDDPGLPSEDPNQHAVVARELRRDRRCSRRTPRATSRRGCRSGPSRC
jgi:competence protein ComEC